MNYKKVLGSEYDLEKELGLDKYKTVKLNNEIIKAFNKFFIGNANDLDKIIAFVAPYIETPEEGFYAAITIIMTHNGIYEQYKKTLN